MRTHAEIVVDYDVCVVEYLRENKKGRETVFASSYWAQVKSVKQKNNGRKSFDTVPLSVIVLSSYRPTSKK